MPIISQYLGGWYDVADQMYAELRQSSRECFQQRQAEKDALKTVADFEAYREKVRANFLNAIGGLPTEKTPLNVKVTGVLQQDGFRIEKTLFESLPGYIVSTACYVPDNIESQAPGVLFFCGHSGNGKAHDTYQKVCRALARNGFVVLAVDPIGQGERLQYWNEDSQTLFHSCTTEHTHAGYPFLLMGASVARHFVWDGIRAFDYLASRDDVDETRIGVTGNSGGGTQSCYLLLAEPRLAAGMPATFPMTLETMQKTGSVQDMEQIVFGAIAQGPDHDDFLTAIAPRPVMAGCVAYDMFPIEGTIEAVERARKVYELYGQVDNAQINIDNSLHCYSDGTRQGCVNWFKKHLKNEEPDFEIGEMEILPGEELNATWSGQVLLDFPESRTITDLTRDYLEALPAPSTSPEELRRNLDEVLGVSVTGERQATIYPRLNNVETRDSGESLQKIWFFSEPDVAVSGVLYSPAGAGEAPLPTTLLLLENGTATEHDERVAKLLDEGRRVFVYDVRGVGGVVARSISSQDLSAGSSPFSSEYKMASDAVMLKQSTMGRRAFDVLRAYDYLKTREDIGEISLHGVGFAATWAYFAAVLETGFQKISCEEMLLSYRELCQTRDYDSLRFNLKIMAWGLLRCGDIEDFLPCITPRELQFIAPLNAKGGRLPDRIVA